MRGLGASSTAMLLLLWLLMPSTGHELVPNSTCIQNTTVSQIYQPSATWLKTTLACTHLPSRFVQVQHQHRLFSVSFAIQQQGGIARRQLGLDVLNNKLCKIAHHIHTFRAQISRLVIHTAPVMKIGVPRMPQSANGCATTRLQRTQCQCESLWRSPEVQRHKSACMDCLGPWGRKHSEHPLPSRG